MELENVVWLNKIGFVPSLDHRIIVGVSVCEDVIAFIKADSSFVFVNKNQIFSSEHAKPDFENVKILDGGNSIKFGAYEVSSSFILHKSKENFRKLLKENRVLVLAD